MNDSSQPVTGFGTTSRGEDYQAVAQLSHRRSGCGSPDEVRAHARGGEGQPLVGNAKKDGYCE